MRAIRLTLAYDGRNYHGWQRQAGSHRVSTVQGRVEEALLKLHPEHSASPPVLLAAGRTDAGVHALGQVAAFRLREPREPGTYLRALNALLPRDIRVCSASEVSPDFHPRYDARGKRYVYLVGAGGGGEVGCDTGDSPFLDPFIWRPRGSSALDVEAMKAAARVFPGRRDFSSMQASGCAARSPVREIRRLEVLEASSADFLGFSFSGEFIRVTVEADAFLRHMVRNIAGALVAAGRGEISAEGLEEILARCDRRLAPPTAPARGLFLERVFYDDP